MKTELKDFDRVELFEHYNTQDNPFLYVTTKVDITNIHKMCKKYYASISYFIAMATNRIENFRYRYEDGQVYLYDKLKPNFTQMLKDNNIGYFTCDFKESYGEFIEEYLEVQNKFHTTGKSCANEDKGEVWCSYVPWYNFTSIITPFNKENTVPQFMWDKFAFEDDNVYINLTIMAHHGFVDGYHIKLFLDEFNEIIMNLEQYIR